METNIEIEYKQLLSQEEYQKIEKYLIKNKHQKIVQENYYFDTKKRLLKKEGQALRIRISDEHNELCLKTKRTNDVLEQNVLLSKKESETILKDCSLINEYLADLPEQLELLGILKTIRIEAELSSGLICLDKSSYAGIEDYEIEFEAKDYYSEAVLIDFLKQFAIVYQANHKTKIQRLSEKLGL